MIKIIALPQRQTATPGRILVTLVQVRHLTQVATSYVSRYTYFDCRFSFSCRSWYSSLFVVRSLKDRLAIWERSSCSKQRLLCSSDLSRLTSASSLLHVTTLKTLYYRTHDTAINLSHILSNIQASSMQNTDNYNGNVI